MGVILKRHIGFLLVLAALLCGTDVFSQPSVLASGEWWQLKVESTGMYRVGLAEAPGLAGASVARIGVYGMRGDQLSTDNTVTPTTDLQPVAIQVVDLDGDGVFNSGDYLMFYGEGVDVWRYDSEDERWEMRRHAYATANYYYLAAEAPTPLRVSLAPARSATSEADWYTAVAVVHNDLINLYHTGQIWLGEKFSAAIPSRNFTLSFPRQASEVKLRYALGYRGSLRGSFSVSAPGLSNTHYLMSDTPYGIWLEAIAQPASQLTLALNFTPGDNTAEGFLDFIEATGKVSLQYGGSQIVARYPRTMTGSAVRYRIQGGTPKVWEVAAPGHEREMTVADGSWSDTTGGPYVLFDAQNLKHPAAVSSLSNQDLHGAPQADYVIVCNPAFRAQALRLANLHEVVDGITTLVVTDREVYNEFSSGKQDPMAIRAFMRHLRATHPAAPPRWLLLFGKASCDPRDIEGRNLPTVVTFESTSSFDSEGVSFCSDDMMGYLDPQEYGSSMQTLDVAIGRLPAKSTEEADFLVDKIQDYLTHSDLALGERGDWRNVVALLADDADPSRVGDTSFTNSSEVTAASIKALFPAINIDRLYADAFRQQSGAIGSYYPDLNNALRQRINNGCLLLNYVGHGSQKYIGTERYIEPSDIATFSNHHRLPLFVTSTCSYGWHDIPDDQCGAELCVLADGAAVAVVSAARPISHNERFNTSLVLAAIDPSNTIGDALRIAKNGTPVSQCIGLTGDPALHLSIPRNQVVVTHIGDHPVTPGVDDTATVLSQVTVRGEIHDPDGNLIPDFDGTVFPIVYDRETQATTLANDNPGAEVGFVQQKSVLYRGSSPVTGGRFSYTFTVPRDVQYHYDYGRLSHYASSGTDDATGSYSRILFGGLNEDVLISEVRPDISLYIGDTNFRNGGLAKDEPTLIAILRDSVGINAFGSGLGHDITAVLDGVPGSLVVLNDFFSADISDPRGGTLRYTYPSLSPGHHTLTLKAWNIWGYSSTATVDFCVRPSDDPGVSSLSVYPNPAAEYAVFHYEVSDPSSVVSAILQIYTAQGALRQSFIPELTPDGQVLGPVRWNLSSVPPGLYLARMMVTLSSGETRQSTTKVIVR